MDGRGVGVLGWGARDISRASGKRGGIVGGSGEGQDGRVDTLWFKYEGLRYIGDPTGQ